MQTIASQDAEGQQSRRVPAGWLLFGLGLVLFFFGFGIQFWFLKRGRNLDEQFWPNLALCALHLALVSWVIAPFFSRRPLWLKIGLSLGLVIVWSMLGRLAQVVVSRIFELPID